MILVGALASLVVAELVLSIGTPYLTVQRRTSLTLLHSFHGQGVRPPLLSLGVELIGIYSVPIQSFSELDSIKVGVSKGKVHMTRAYYILGMVPWLQCRLRGNLWCYLVRLYGFASRATNTSEVVRVFACGMSYCLS